MATTNDDINSQELSGVQGRPVTPEEVARHDGYVEGRTDESYAQGTLRTQDRTAAQAQANDSAASGLLIGLLVALIAAGAGAALYFLTGDRTEPAPVAVPQIEKETVKETTVIEREMPSSDVSLPDVQINVPDVAVPDVNVPDININNEVAAPTTEPAAEPAATPAAEPAAAPKAKSAEPKAELVPEQPTNGTAAE